MFELSAALLKYSSYFRTVLLAFINCLIISTPQLKDRNRLRNEFIGKQEVIKNYPENMKHILPPTDI